MNFLNQVSNDALAKEKDFLACGQRTWDKREDLQGAFDLATFQGCSDFWYWLVWHGVHDEMNVDAQELRGFLPALPPSFLTGRVFGEESSAQEFLRGGLVDWKRFLISFREHLGIDSLVNKEILDFGGGCARIARNFLPFSGSTKLSLCDIDGDAIQWIKESMPWIRPQVSQPSPPLPYADDSFDLVYSFSVFSHMPAPTAIAWLEELKRVVRPGGGMVLTTQGQHVIDRILANDVEHHFPDKETLKSNTKRWQETGNMFFPYREVHSETKRNREFFEEWDLESYGTFFASETYAHDVWGKTLEIKGATLGADDWQDFYAFRNNK